MTTSFVPNHDMILRQDSSPPSYLPPASALSRRPPALVTSEEQASKATLSAEQSSRSVEVPSDDLSKTDVCPVRSSLRSHSDLTFPVPSISSKPYE